MLSEENVIKILTTVIPTLLVALIVPIYGIRFALRQFYTQKWWETKSSNYSIIVECLSNYRYATGELFEHYTTNEIYNREIISRYEKLIKESFEEIKKQISVGAFVVSISAIDELAIFIRKVETNPDSISGNHVGSLDSNCGYAVNSIDTIKTIAKKDLKIK
ncbi:hypothetical protein [Paenibacillus crassostreae]|uniref:Uncharacterized protein n=1 Tax=Paenibacillus crassostreae TaxID=1763538 RepID=A0A167AV26_9BACL|nr:hypothetical protein [Paenibacillus crassostreae]AOZ93639.1 hypothetical protein LPB68_16520 [Paenibacillus crassostreae]OAB71466.1 hypothetical protein PNBC_19390 [Paenibacillus crassostreae]